jgi:hypothetical protein
MELSQCARFSCLEVQYRGFKLGSAVGGVGKQAAILVKSTVGIFPVTKG